MGTYDTSCIGYVDQILLRVADKAHTQHVCRRLHALTVHLVGVIGDFAVEVVFTIFGFVFGGGPIEAVRTQVPIVWVVAAEVRGVISAELKIQACAFALLEHQRCHTGTAPFQPGCLCGWHTQRTL